jgi:hypothetical protein
MQIIQLNNNFSLSAEAENKKLRLIILNKGEEYVCHKTTAGELLEFLAGGDNQLFKGRLQLLKNNNSILIKVKGKIEGAVNEEELKKIMGEAQLVRV